MSTKRKVKQPTRKTVVGVCLVFPSQELREHFQMSAMLQGETMTGAMLEMVRVYIAKGPKRSILMRAINKKKGPE